MLWTYLLVEVELSHPHAPATGNETELVVWYVSVTLVRQADAAKVQRIAHRRIAHRWDYVLVGQVDATRPCRLSGTVAVGVVSRVAERQTKSNRIAEAGNLQRFL